MKLACILTREIESLPLSQQSSTKSKKNSSPLPDPEVEGVLDSDDYEDAHGEPHGSVQNLAKDEVYFKNLNI